MIKKPNNYVIVNKLDSNNLPRKNIPNLDNINKRIMTDNRNIIPENNNFKQNIVSPNLVNQNMIENKLLNSNLTKVNTPTNIGKLNNLSALNKKILIKNNNKIIELQPNKNIKVIDGLKNAFFTDTIFRMLSYYIFCYIIISFTLFPNCLSKGNSIFIAIIWLVIDLIRICFSKLNNQEINNLMMVASILMETGIIIYTIFSIINAYREYVKWKKMNNQNTSIKEYIKYTFTQ